MPISESKGTRGVDRGDDASMAVSAAANESD